ncbi:unnamed protein product, partial [Nesidiocoris tenuis]
MEFQIQLHSIELPGPGTAEDDSKRSRTIVSEAVSDVIAPVQATPDGFQVSWSWKIGYGKLQNRSWGHQDQSLRSINVHDSRRLSSLTVSKTPPPKSLRSTQSEQRLGSTKKSIPLRTVSSENKSKDVVESRKEENTGKSTEEEKILKLLELSCPKVKPAVDREESKSVA